MLEIKEITEKISTSKFWIKVLWFIPLMIIVFLFVAELGSALKFPLEEENPGTWRIIIVGTSFAIALAIFLFILSRTTVKIWFHKQSLRTKRGYVSQLAKNFNQMPFIYPELIISDVFTIREDYVSASYKYFPIRKNDGTGIDQMPETLTACANSMLTNCSRVLLFGQAGMGKTSFLQHTILSIIHQDTAIVDFNPFRANGKVVPIFVPLKILSNELPFPIIRHILRIPFFSGRKGLRRLLRLAEEKRIALFLDGYDEIVFRKHSKNSIIRELNFIFSGDFKKAIDQPDPVNEFYSLLKRFNSAWLTSRLSFFADHPLELVKDEHEVRKNRHYYENFIKDKLHSSGSRTTTGSVIITGIEEKAKLIEKLIEKYSRRQPHLAGSLTVGNVLNFVNEYFNFSELDVMDNPLFLTIFFYIYVKVHIEKEGKVDQPLTLKMAVELCTDLILRDLDKSKVRGLAYSGVHQRLECDPDEKKEFIKFFAYQYYINKKLQGKGSFTKKDLFEVGSLFSEKYVSLNKSQANEKAIKIISEILKQNFFIIVAEEGDARYYDFPHRRFKEFFAIDFFNTGDNFDLLLEHVDDPLFYDFILLYYNSSTQNSDQLLDYLMSKMRASRNLGKTYSLFNECLAQKTSEPAKYKLLDFAEFLIYEGNIESLSSELINALQPGDEFYKKMELRLRGLVNDAQDREFYRICKVYVQIDKEKGSHFLFHFVVPQMVKEKILADSLLHFLYSSLDADKVSSAVITHFDNSDFSSCLNSLMQPSVLSKIPNGLEGLFLFFSNYQKSQFLVWATAFLTKPGLSEPMRVQIINLLVDQYMSEGIPGRLKGAPMDFKTLVEVIIMKLEADEQPSVLEQVFKESSAEQRELIGQVIFEKMSMSLMFLPPITGLAKFLLLYFPHELCYQAVNKILNPTSVSRIVAFFKTVEGLGSNENLLNEFCGHLNDEKTEMIKAKI